MDQWLWQQSILLLNCPCLLCRLLLEPGKKCVWVIGIWLFLDLRLEQYWFIPLFWDYHEFPWWHLPPSAVKVIFWPIPFRIFKELSKQPFCWTKFLHRDWRGLPIFIIFAIETKTFIHTSFFTGWFWLPANGTRMLISFDVWNPTYVAAVIFHESEWCLLEQLSWHLTI